jgi:hypothetical protein
MWKSGRPSRYGRALLVLAVALAGANAACTLLVSTDVDPHRCNTDADCAHLPNAACDNARRVCVPRFPSGGGDGGLQADGGDTGGGLMCQLSFDNAARLTFTGPDGGLRPLPEAP